MGRDGSRAYRVRQIPHTFDKVQIATLLARCLQGIESAGDVTVLSLASTANPWERPRTKVATVAFTQTPTWFTDGGSEWLLSSSETKATQNIIIDSHFLDFTVLNDPEYDQFVDCIAISGLASHPYGTWTSQVKGSQFMWLRDRLPYDLPNIRSITYGYDTKLLLSQSFQTIEDLAVSLIVKLKSIGRHLSSSKPLLFLVHSLGGIVFKRALVLLANGSEAERSILKSIIGVLFFGVPNEGMFMTHLLPMIEGQPNENLVQQLAPDSKFLAVLEQQFQGISELQRVRLVSIYETQQSKTMAEVEPNKWDRVGPPEILVKKSSAIQLGSQATDVFPIDKDHSAMVKFSESSPDYQGVLTFLREICFQSSDPLVMEDAMSDRTSVASRQTSNSSMDKADPVKYLEVLKITDRTQISRQDLAFLLERMTESFKSQETEYGMKQVDKALGSSFDWIFSRPDFKRWLAGGYDVYWISGKPGSGKSTLMKYIVENSLTKHSLLNDDPRHASGSYKLATARFFFYGRGSGLQKTFEGLLRGVLDQLVRQVPELKMLILHIYQNWTRLPFRRDWSLDDLEEAFSVILSQKSFNLTVVLFLDALDEYDGSLDIAADFIKSLLKTRVASLTQVRVCFSSRLENVFVDNFEACPGFKIHEHTRPDILAMVEEKMRSNRAFNELVLLSSSARAVSRGTLDIREEILQKAQGVFLWVRFTLEELVRLATEGISETEAHDVLSKMPEKLEEMYERILDKVESKNRPEMYAMLETALRAHKTMSLLDFSVAVRCAYRPTLKECMQQIPFRVPSRMELNTYARRIKSRCGGLLEIIGEADSAMVQFMHETVKSWAQKPSFQQRILENEYQHRTENGYTFLSKYLLALLAVGEITYLIRQEDEVEGSEKKDDPDGRNEALDQRTRHEELKHECLEYFFMAESTTGCSQAPFFNTIEDGVIPKIFSSNMRDLRPVGWRILPVSSLLSFAVVANLELYLKEMLSYYQQQQLVPQESLLHRAIEVALASQWLPKNKNSTRIEKIPDTIEVLLEYDFLRKMIWDDKTPVQFLVAHSANALSERTFRIGLVFLAAEQEANMDLLRDSVKCKPLHILACLPFFPETPDAITLALKSGAQVNALNSRGYTPLDICIQKGVFELERRAAIGEEKIRHCFAVAVTLHRAGGKSSSGAAKEKKQFFDLIKNHFDVSIFFQQQHLAEMPSSTGRGVSPGKQGTRHKGSTFWKLKRLLFGYR